MLEKVKRRAMCQVSVVTLTAEQIPQITKKRSPKRPLGAIRPTEPVAQQIFVKLPNGVEVALKTSDP